MDALNTPHDDLHAYFLQCIENHYIRDIRVEHPPYMMRTELSPSEVREKIKLLIKPVAKEILNGLFKLDKSKRKVRDVSQSGAPEIAVAREDNLEMLSGPVTTDTLL